MTEQIDENEFSTFQELLDKDGSVLIHMRNIQIFEIDEVV